MFIELRQDKKKLLSCYSKEAGRFLEFYVTSGSVESIFALFSVRRGHFSICGKRPA